VKEVRWIGNSRSVVREFPKSARRKVGEELTRVQLGIETPKPEIELARRRYRMLIGESYG